MGSGKNIDWLNHSLEFFVVVIGILLAFQLNKCSGEKGHQEIIDIHLKEIEKETKLNKNSLESSIKFTEENIVKLDTILQLLEKKEDYNKVNYLSLSLLNLGGTYLRKNAYLTLTESADIRYMKSFEQKQEIVNLYEYYKWVESYDELSRDLHAQDFYPYLKENFDLVGGSLQDLAIYDSKLFKNILGAYNRTSQNRLSKYKDCLKVVNSYLNSNR